MIDVITRLLPGVLPDEEAWQLESFFGRFIGWPQYTRPRVWRDRAVPDVLLSGHQANIDRERESLAAYRDDHQEAGIIEWAVH